MRKGEATVLLKREKASCKLCKVIFGNDGSYMVLVPYHPHKKCTMFKIPVNYTTSVNGEAVPYAETIDAGQVEDKEVKLSHHRSGFVQFSGPGVLSGKDEHGNPKGLGIQSFALDKPAVGPSFAVSFLGLEAYRQVAQPLTGAVVFSEEDLAPVEGANTLILEGFYFPPPFRRFVKPSANRPMINFVHPTGSVMELAVVLAPTDSSWPGLIGLHLYPAVASFGTDVSGFIISGPTANVRINEKNDKVAEGIYCACPGTIKLPRLRDLNFPRSSENEAV